MAQRIKYKITDIEKLQAAFPEVVMREQVIRNVVNKEKLYKLIKTFHAIGRPIDGVEMEASYEPEMDLGDDDTLEVSKGEDVGEPHPAEEEVSE